MRRFEHLNEPPARSTRGRVYSSRRTRWLISIRPRWPASTGVRGGPRDTLATLAGEWRSDSYNAERPNLCAKIKVVLAAPHDA
jgi:hypothetical protein